MKLNSSLINKNKCMQFNCKNKRKTVKSKKDNCNYKL